MKKITVNALIIVLLASGFAGCGGEVPSSSDPVIGVWRAEKFLTDGQELDFEADPELYLVFSENELLRYSFEDAPAAFKWAWEDEGTISVSDESGSTVSSFKYENDELTEVIDENSVIIYAWQVPVEENVIGRWELTSVLTYQGVFLDLPAEGGTAVFNESTVTVSVGGMSNEYKWEAVRVNRINITKDSTIFKVNVNGDYIRIDFNDAGASYYFKKSDQ